jgi:hypothetical protein
MNVFEPTREDILEWAYGTDKKWPASDWDYYVLNPAHDELILDLASDRLCPNREFFVHALYYFVGTAFNREHLAFEKMSRITRLLARVDPKSPDDVCAWRERAGKLLDGEIAFERELWLHYLFRETDDPGAN